MGTIAQNLESVLARIDSAARHAGRDAQAVRLVAVSKTHPFSMIQEAYGAGQRDFGENRLEELLPKMDEAQAAGLTDIRWHLIGPIQSRKTQMAIVPLALIHAVDRLKIATRLSRDAQTAGQCMPVLLEVNVSGEASKHGFAPEELDGAVGEALSLPGIRVEGLMTMAPFVEDEAVIRAVFGGLRRLRDHLCAEYPQMGTELSMGMTNDFEIAVTGGATLVRVGSAIFGERQV
ncbi:MAG: YggS family pyridoxal phosphate-dependent enzyme [Litorilinea sp.]